MAVDPLVVERAVLQVMSGRALSPEDLHAMETDDLIAIARRLGEESRRELDALKAP